MLTVLEAINKSADYLASKKIESPRANAELFLASILNCKRLDLYMMFDRPLSETEMSKYREYLKRRSNFEPLQYIIGKVEFYGLELMINPEVLIPRPETELLVEAVINQVSKSNITKILDIGTGSGNIAIALAANLPDVSLTAIDISESSIKIAKRNSELLHLEERISFYCSDILKMNETDYTEFDVVVSNPPYVSAIEYKDLQKEIKDYEPDFAVTDFSDGYKFYERIILLSKNILKSGGHLFFELAEGQSGNVKNIFLQHGFRNISVIRDYQGINRIINAVNN